MTNCETCGSTFEFHPYREAKFCSKECWAKRGSTKLSFSCLNCHSVFKGYKKSRKFCSNECCYKYRVGENAPAFKDGKSLERERARHSTDIKKWRFAVFSRDEFTCQHCKKKSERDIHAHHIKEWHLYPNDRFDVNNGITLCVHCHGKVHGKNLANRKSKYCKECSNPIKNKENKGLCRSCAAKLDHQKRKEKSGFIQLSFF